MAHSNGTRPSLSFAKLGSIMEMPDLLSVQFESFSKLIEGLGEEKPSGEAWVFGLDRVFRTLFPIESAARDMELEYVSASLGQPKYTVEECLERGMSYSAALTAVLRLVHYTKIGRSTRRKVKKATEKEVYLGNLPLLTPLGTFVVHGVERVVVSQLHRSPGVYFEEDRHQNGSRLHKARVIPFRGSWADFTVDINNVAWAHIDKKKKFPVTTLLRALGYGTDASIYRRFLTAKYLKVAKAPVPKTTEEAMALCGEVLAEDLTDPETGEAACAWTDATVAFADLRSGDKLAEDIADPETGEIACIWNRMDVLLGDLRTNDVLKEDVADPETGEVAFLCEDLALAPNELRPGDEVAEDVANPETDEILLEEGQTLDQKALKTLSKTLGEKGVSVRRPGLQLEVDAILQSPLDKNNLQRLSKTFGKKPVSIHRRGASFEAGTVLDGPLDHENLQRLSKTLGERRVNVRRDPQPLADGCELNEGQVRLLLDLGNRRFIRVYRTGADRKQASRNGAGGHPPAILKNTVKKDPTRSEEDALRDIYKRLRPGDAPNLKTAWAALERVFFDPKRYDLGRVGRYKVNQRLGLKAPHDECVLTREDFVAILTYLFGLTDGRGRTDDIDHLGNRRVRTAGELVANAVSTGLSRMSRQARERMSSNPDPDDVTVDHLVNARTISAVIHQFFGSSGSARLSQYMDQTNPLAELTHKRRLSALGPGGLTRERAGFEVRDVHYSQYGRVCPIETPEGANVGLIASLATHARINELGFVETPYRKVLRGRVTQKIEWLSANEEYEKTIAQANAPLKDDRHFRNEYVLCRHQGDFPLLKPEEIDYMDVAPTQLVSAAAALIPFLEHDDANRALMGSNMQRQAVPLLHTEAPVVGTGMEGKVARDSGAAVTAKRGGRVRKVTAEEIVVDTGPRRSRAKDKVKDPLAKLSQFERYRLRKFRRTNQDTAVNERPLVAVGDRVKMGQVIADGPATDRGRLALGRNVRAAIMPWYGYNFEDAIVISERLVRQDVFTSIHVQELDLHVRDTKLGPEEITREIPNVTDDMLLELDEHGIVRVGARVRSGDILCGKITPKGEKKLSPEEKLLTAIFGDKAKDVKDSSLRVPPGMTGTVIDVRVFSRQPNDRLLEVEQGMRIGALRTEERDMIERIHAARDAELKKLLKGQAVALCLKRGTVDEFLEENAIFTPDVLRKLDFRELDLGQLKVQNHEVTEQIHAVIRAAQDRIALERERTEEQIDRAYKPDELSPGVVQLVRVYVAAKRKLSVGDKMAGRHGNKGIVARIAPEEDMPFLPDGSSVDVVLNPLGVPSRMNLGQVLEAHLGWVASHLGFVAETPVFHGAVEEEIGSLLKLAGAKWASEALGADVAWPLRAEDTATLLETIRAHPEFGRSKASDADEGADGDPASAGRLAPSLDEYVAVSDDRSRRLFTAVAEFVVATAEAAAASRAADVAEAFPAATSLKKAGKLETGLEAAVKELMDAGGLAANGKIWLRDGRSGRRLDFPVTVGDVYMLKLSHLVDDKIHARSIGPYSLVAQQPLAGKAQFGGQRFGEMEVWALEAYGAAHTLQEILTVKSDDVVGRARTYEAMVKGDNLPKPGVPESFNVLVKEMQALGLAVELGQSE